MNACLLLPERSATRAVIEAVTDFATRSYSAFTRSIVREWNLDDEEYDALRFYTGYLDFVIENAYIDEIVYEYGVQVFYVCVSMYAGVDYDILIGDPEIFAAYRDDDGEWDVEWDSC